jgi:hypothetical protein
MKSVAPIDIASAPCTEDAPAPRVSVCVTVYSHEPFLRRCLQSLVDQALPWPFEVIVGEDCSKDRSRAIVEEFAREYPAIIRPLLHPSNLGMCGNLRAVHTAARGEYVCHCDGDDHWEPGKLEAEVALLDAHPELVAVFTNAWVVSEQEERIGLFNRGVPPVFDTSYLIRDGNFLHHSSIMYRRRWQASALPSRSSFVDFEIYVLLGRQGLFGYIDRPLTTYRAQSSASAIHNDNAGIRRLVWQALCEVSPGQASARALRRAQGVFLADAAWQALRCGRPRRYIEWLALAQRRLGRSVWAVQGLAIALLLGHLLRRLAFHARVKLGLSSANARVFYPK